MLSLNYGDTCVTSTFVKSPSDDITTNKTVQVSKSVDISKDIKFVSRNPEIATISKDGKITAISKGTAKIDIIVGNSISNVVVNVK